MNVIYHIHSCLTAVDNCENSGNWEWKSRYKERAERLVKEYLPSGGGFDNGVSIIDWRRDRIRFSADFHHMNQCGFYDGWTSHVVTVKPAFVDINISVSGKNKNDIRDYIVYIFLDFLLREIDFNKFCSDRSL